MKLEPMTPEVASLVASNIRTTGFAVGFYSIVTGLGDVYLTPPTLGIVIYQTLSAIVTYALIAYGIEWWHRRKQPNVDPQTIRGIRSKGVYVGEVSGSCVRIEVDGKVIVDTTKG